MFKSLPKIRAFKRTLYHVRTTHTNKTTHSILNYVCLVVISKPPKKVIFTNLCWDSGKATSMQLSMVFTKIEISCKRPKYDFCISQTPQRHLRKKKHNPSHFDHQIQVFLHPKFLDFARQSWKKWLLDLCGPVKNFLVTQRLWCGYSKYFPISIRRTQTSVFFGPVPVPNFE